MGLTLAKDSPILDQFGKPFKTQAPVTVDRECSTLTTTIYLLPKLRHGETYEDWARRCGRIDNVGLPK